MIQSIVSIIKSSIMFLLKFGFLLFVFKLVSNVIAFTLYHIYYGFIVGGGYFLCNATLNIIFYSGVGFIAYIIYNYIYN